MTLALVYLVLVISVFSVIVWLMPKEIIEAAKEEKVATKSQQFYDKEVENFLRGQGS